MTKSNLWEINDAEWTDAELITASKRFSEYTERAEEKIRAELRHRQMPEPEPTVRTVRIEHSNLPIKSDEKPIDASRILLGVGIVIAVIGVGLILISPSFIFHDKVPGQFLGTTIMYDRTTDLTGQVKFIGIALLIVGSIISAVGFSKLKSTEAATPQAPTTQPLVTQGVSPQSVELGNNPDEVQSVMGQPDKIINLGGRVIHVYKDMKIVYDDGKVSDVQLS